MAATQYQIETRKTRIVCISDTHNQTPKLPKGDILIHAGDITNQGSFSELQKSVDWLEKADFEAKIVVAGNHDLTLDSAFFEKHGSSWRWPKPQDPEACRRLLKESQSLIYLENEAAAVYLDGPKGPHTCLKVFGSPATPSNRNWAFQYSGDDEASKLWDTIPLDTDVVITHTPAEGHCDTATKDDRSGCRELIKALHRVRPMLSVCGHIHEARGVERVLWNDVESGVTGNLVRDFEKWTDPGIGSKQSLVNFSMRGGRPLMNSGMMTRQTDVLNRIPSASEGSAGVQPGPLVAASHAQGVNSEAELKAGGAIVYRQAARLSDIGLAEKIDVDDPERAQERRETVMINAAFLGPRISGGPKTFNKPIVVDVDLPVWR